MLFGLRVSVLFRHSKIDDMDDIGCFAVRPTDQEVIWLDIAVDEIFFVNRLDA